jgi:cysteine synthase
MAALLTDSSATRAVFDEVTEAQLLPRLIQLDRNLYVAAFTLMKLLPARHILRQAIDRGELRRGGLIVETTSGTFGLALAMETALLGCRLVLVSDPVMDERLRRRLADLGADVVICHEPDEVGGFQGVRLRKLAEIRDRHPGSFCPEQYSNPGNPGAYRIVAEHLIKSLEQVDCLIGPVGSGGSMCGTVRHLRLYGHDVRAVGVDTPGSVLFGQPDRARPLRGLGNSLLPPNLDHRVFDEVHWCTAGEAFAATRALHRRHALFHGPTSGAAYQVGRWWSARHPDARCVIMLPDEGHRYQDTVYNDSWLTANGFTPAALPAAPQRLSSPDEEIDQWGWFSWERRDYAAATGNAGAGTKERADG